MKAELIEKAYAVAKERYAAMGVDTDKAIAELEAAGINEYVAEVNRQLAEFMAK